MTVGGGDVEMAVVVGIEEGDAEAQPIAGRHRQPTAVEWSQNRPRPRLR
jgi:hypothetical protein